MFRPVQDVRDLECTWPKEPKAQMLDLSPQEKQRAGKQGLAENLSFENESN